MQRLCETTVNLLVAGVVLLGSAAAQQTPASTTGATTAKPRASSTTTTAARHKSTVAAKPKPMVLTTEKDKQSYAIGLNIGKSLHRDGVDVEPKVFLQGLQDALAGGKVLLTDDEMKTVMTDLQKDLQQKLAEKRQALIESNKKDGAAFLAANATKPGVVTLPSGLQYKVLVAGTGPKPSATDSVVCNYRGTLLDNTVVVWIPELGTPTHLHYDLLLLLAGGCNGFFDTGQYVRYPRNLANPLAGMPMTGPGHNRLHVSLMQAMGQPDTSFGLTEVTGSDGSTVPLTGPLTEIQATG